MALTAPLPPAGAPRPGQDLAGLTQMMTGGADPRQAMTDALLAKLKPAITLIGDLETLMTANPEIVPIIQTIVQTKFGGRGGARRNQGQGVQPPMPPVAPGMPVGQPVPPSVAQLPPTGAAPTGMLPMPRGAGFGG